VPHVVNESDSERLVEQGKETHVVLCVLCAAIVRNEDASDHPPLRFGEVESRIDNFLEESIRAST
jgi:hypothetical protein